MEDEEETQDMFEEFWRGRKEEWRLGKEKGRRMICMFKGR